MHFRKNWNNEHKQYLEKGQLEEKIEEQKLIPYSSSRDVAYH